MASFATLAPLAPQTTTKTFTSSFTTTSPTISSWPLLSKKCSLNNSLKHKVSCNADNSFDRRNVLLGLGGLAGAVNLSSIPSSAAAPIAAPDISKCGTKSLSGFKQVEDTATVKGTPTGGDCCPPDSSQILDFQFPKNQAFKIRPAAHLLSPKYIAKFNLAIKRMKELPEDDPRNFLQQARIHCAYCNGAYTQSSSGFPDIEIQIHNSWLFFPFHRWYLYFYERILGSLINDPTFALPFWNWDTPAGMTIPKYFKDPKSALYDPKRNPYHLNAVVDLGFDGKDKDTTDIEKVKNNLGIMYRYMVTNATDPEGFFGKPYRAGSSSAGSGSIEQNPHVPVHRWVGDPRETNGENLGNFYSAGRDTLFYCHHSNVDRMWSLWKMMGGKHVDINDPDYLNTSFVFYDENKNLVRVYVKDSLLTKKLGYDYQRVDVPWLKSKPVPRAPRSGIARKLAGTVKQTNDVSFPVKLDKIMKVLVPRPKKSRSKKEKEDREELLIIDGITYDSEKYVKFDVYVNDEDDKEASSPDQSEFVGSFAQLPHKHKGKMESKASFRAGLTELLEDLEADDDDNVLLTLVPKSGCEDITLENIFIVFA